MSRQAEIAAAADQRVRNWPSESRAALLERLTAKPVVKPLNHGISVDVGEDFPVWCADEAAMRRLLARRDLLAAELADS